MNVERVLTTDALPERLHQVVGAAHGIDRFAAAPDPLVGVDLHEHAAAHVGALQIGNLQRRRPRGLPGAVDRLSEDLERSRGGRGSKGCCRQERTPAGGRFPHHAPPRYRISKMNTRPPGSGVGPACTVPAGTNSTLGVLAGVDASKISSTALRT